MMSDAACRFLDWDSAFFGRRIARVQGAGLDRSKMRRVADFVRTESIDCLYYLVDDGDLESIEIAEEGGFRCMDVRVTRERSLADLSPDGPADVDSFREGDLSALQAIARSSHGATRFYHDPGFPRERCDALYERWITNSCTASCTATPTAEKGAEEGVLVVREDGEAVGYVTCESESASTGRIGLIAVAENHRGRGFGELLVKGSLAWLARKGHERVRVVSQARNAESGRLYERLGFVTIKQERWYHFWPDAGHDS
jgi:dTDP-4-amino-4,6-dideoxy-D-galactose acyltransferase